MISKVEREGSGTPIGSTRERMAISPAACWMSARCGTGAPLVIQVKIAGPLAFSECAQFSSKGFLIGVAIGPDSARGTVAVRMKCLGAHRGRDEPLICRQVEFDLGPAA